ncbi:tyrosine-type recombinase/integrase [Chroococcus sp. FPU101]|uniref:tyrosine-type recombinase/integrase n=1 Tax=Chroococcus sp. FPU101 TaxID=1974212 RepID=UPI001A8D374B|nr:tyrosine-type recombinase/integrase [Chroococcus sp. FPU101]GFE71800.1 integrase family protein [Chroococcus sp. FPU101]
MRSSLVTIGSVELTPTESYELIFTQFLNSDVGDGAASDDTRKTYRTNLKAFLIWCQKGNLDPLDATRSNLKAYRHWLISKKYQTTTISLKLSVVRRFYDALIEASYLTSNPASGLKAPLSRHDPAERINYLQPDELYRLLESLPTEDTVAALRDRFLVAIMALQGCRTVEMHRARMGDIVRQGEDVGLRVSGKRSSRIVPLTPDLADLLERYLRRRKRDGEKLSSEKPLFISLANGTRGQPLSRRSIQRIVERYFQLNDWKPTPARETKKKLDTKDGSKTKKATTPRLKKGRTVNTEQRHLSTHSLRHTAGTLALRAGASLRQVQDLLGHKDPRTTIIYAHIADRWRNNPALWLERPAL